MKNRINKLVHTFAEGRYSKRITNLFHHWLVNSDASPEKDEALKEIWSKAEGKPSEDTDASFQQVLGKLGLPYISIAPYRRSISIRQFVAAAAAIVIIAVSATWWAGYSYFDKDNAEMVELYVKNGQREEVRLPDGTSICLNSGSHILYPKNFQGKTRTVYLVGEAYFKVKKNPEKPFIVHSSNMKVTALGTEFNVKAYPEEELITASLIEGKVRVCCNDTVSYLLTPGYQTVYNRLTAKSEKMAVDSRDVTAWQRGEIIFNNVPLSEIIYALERYYGITFHFSSHNSSNTDRYSFVFKKDADIKEVLEVMQIVVGDFHYVLKDDNCYITW